jgi:hypothetical protein
LNKASDAKSYGRPSSREDNARRIAESDTTPCLEHATKAWFSGEFIMYNAPYDKPSRVNRTSCPKRQIKAGVNRVEIKEKPIQDRTTAQ